MRTRPIYVLVPLCYLLAQGQIGHTQFLALFAHRSQARNAVFSVPW